MKNILIVEDDPIVSHVFLKRFRIEGWLVALAASGEIALEVLRSSVPDLVVLDLQLPKVPGIEVLRFLRSQPATRRVPVIVFSNAFRADQFQEAKDAGATLCFTKAICTPAQLTDAVRSLLEPAPAPASSPAAGTPAAGAARSLPALHVKPASAHTTRTPRRQLKGIVSDPEAAGLPPAKEATLEPPVVRESPSDVKFQAEVRKNFTGDAVQSITALRHGLHTFVLNESDSKTTRWQADRSRILQALFQTSHTLSRRASVAGMAGFARLAAALEALLGELHDRPDTINPSTLRTVSHAVDFLETLVGDPSRSGGTAASAADPIEGAIVLAVDDEPISRKAVLAGIEKAGLTAVSLGDALAALNKLATPDPFDTIVLDVDMPRMNGYELCVKLRALPARAKTPVVFVTSLSDFQSCARSAISGGNDLIAKPILPIELAVKVIMFVMQSRLGIVTKSV